MMDGHGNNRDARLGRDGIAWALALFRPPFPTFSFQNYQLLFGFLYYFRSHLPRCRVHDEFVGQKNGLLHLGTYVGRYPPQRFTYS